MTADNGPIGNVRETAVAGALTVSSRPFHDDRGRFARLFDRDALAAIHAGRPIVQVNHSLTRQVGALRGIHFQKTPYSEAKWVRCIKGRVFDIAVDLRRASPTFLKHATVELSAESANMFFLPEGCAHGFQVIEPDSELLYLHTAPYSPGAEGGVRWDDPLLAINWPLDPTDISKRDLSHPLLTQEFEGLNI
ncbi:MAG: dTDP-4-dehydrorhamnose 3,5-epimerase family protein [Sphingobium sp.]|uniref:dTDP-4-dehydrorhamnose 3,5-epimerase family protein n=1 Tax=Sphingobium sp. CECT 9361 TaxID=2845384 RepID=UPI001E488B2E|nr:dTDP-4-dehydrorhamnose 3,5-epimerase family protein [Sphingobium sp. CECT 9361]CAH0357000.1 dTDP-4-dehydrorhamnose 3,5-epimerase [Sphingobium sp. CECT 9361]